jgi:uncharacterized protein DUF3667
VSTVAAGQSTCSNCGAPLAGPFCAACGQKSAAPNPTIADFLHELSHELLHVDGKIVQSLRLLITAPGRLTKEQFEGRRIRHVSPIRLYLTFSVVYFAVAALTPDVNFRITVGGQRARGFTFNARNERVDSDPAELRQLGFENQAQLEKATGDAIVHWTPRAMFLLVPLFAAMVGVTVRRSGRNYPQQLYFALHVHAAWFLMLALATLTRFLPSPPAILSIVVPVVMLAYLVLALRRAYDLSAGGALWRSVLIAAAYSIVLVATLASIVIPAVFRHAAAAH